MRWCSLTQPRLPTPQEGKLAAAMEGARSAAKALEAQLAGQAKRVDAYRAEADSLGEQLAVAQVGEAVTPACILFLKGASGQGGG